jgi:hypothetical protein
MCTTFNLMHICGHYTDHGFVRCASAWEQFCPRWKTKTKPTRVNRNCDECQVNTPLVPAIYFSILWYCSLFLANLIFN